MVNKLDMMKNIPCENLYIELSANNSQIIDTKSFECKIIEF